MLGRYENFPNTIHFSGNFTFSLPKRKIQEIFTQIFQKINQENFSFEDLDNPTAPGCTVIFEFGIADTGGFNFLDAEEAQKLLKTLENEPLPLMDWFCGLRYYKNTNGKRTPLKFDYYMLRLNFEQKGTVEMLVFHERGPRYISPEDLTTFAVQKVNESSAKKILKSAPRS